MKQLEDYEEAVMAKRLAEMPAAELDRLLAEVPKPCWLNPADAERAEVHYYNVQTASHAYIAMARREWFVVRHAERRAFCGSK